MFRFFFDLVALHHLMVEEVGLIDCWLGLYYLLRLLGLTFWINILANEIVSHIDILVVAAFLEQIYFARRLELDHARVTALKLRGLLNTILLAAACCFPTLKAFLSPCNILGYHLIESLVV